MLFLRRSDEQRSTLANRDNENSRDETSASSRTSAAKTLSWGALADTSRYFEAQRTQRVDSAERSQMELQISSMADNWIERTRTRLQPIDLD
jgi:hypothetical protein